MSTHPTQVKGGIFIFFMIITMIIGIMIVCFTKPKSGMIELLYIEIISRVKEKFARINFNF
jgi:hypothetical protein